MESGSESTGSVEVIDVDGPDVEPEVEVYEGWVRRCPTLPPIARAELLARAVVAFGNHQFAPEITRGLQYWADQRPRIPARLLANLIQNETPSLRATSFAHVQNEVTPNRGTLHEHAVMVVHPFDQVRRTIVPVFTLDNTMIAWREALPPRADDAAEPPEFNASAGDVGHAQ
jgi:hypothetical protein